MVTEEEWSEWLHHPATKLLHKWLAEQRCLLKERWAAGEFTDMSQFGTAIQNAKAIGNCEALELVEKLEYLQIVGDMSDAGE